jgi:hypothetical protein
MFLFLSTIHNKHETNFVVIGCVYKIVTRSKNVGLKISHRDKKGGSIEKMGSKYGFRKKGVSNVVAEEEKGL